MAFSLRVRSLTLCGLILLANVSYSSAQASPASPTLTSQPSVAPAPHTSDTPDLLRETQQGLREPGFAGLVWWIPFEFWIDSGLKRGNSAEKTTHDLGALKDYTVVVLFAAQVSPLGSFTFTAPSDLEKKVVLRDHNGEEYGSILNPSQDAKTLATVLRPVLGNALGKAGENSEMIFFPARGHDGRLIADPTAKGSFSVVVKDILGVPQSIYAWRTPLTSVAAPKHCPIGKELMHADWDYCPWHGAKLDEPVKP